MAQYRSLLAIALLAASLHTWAISRTLLPAQDGLKFIRVARQFQTDPWEDVVRGADVHPLYPALIATAEPVVAYFSGPGPDAWRIAAQVVAALAAVGLLFPVYFLTQSLFDRRIAFLAAGLLALLPRAAEMGHDTLADSLGLFATILALWLGARAWRTADWRVALGSGFVAGAGYLARPKIILVPVAIGLTWLLVPGRSIEQSRTRRLTALSVLLLGSALMVASYAAVKGEISEKIVVRFGGWLGPGTILNRPVPQQVPRGLDDPRLDFSPKEETDHIPIQGWRSSSMRITGKWWEELCWGFAVMTVWGLVRRTVHSKPPGGSQSGRRGWTGGATSARIHPGLWPGPAGTFDRAGLPIGPARHDLGRRLDPMGRGGHFRLLSWDRLETSLEPTMA